ncbi:MAG: glycosyltransferase family 39 protein [Candidatus Eisenbacteria bacterium]|nr:glycosyltransferase family 39 protein [Candidatus Eisenbacteria bacterium]
MAATDERSEWTLVLGLAVLSLALFLVYWDVGVNDDEGYLLGGVTRILDGQVLYRDFHHTYAPGRFYLVAGLFRLFGENLLVLRAFWVILRVAVVLLAYAAGRRVLSRPAAFAAALLFIVAPGPWHKSFFHLFVLLQLIAFAGLGRRDSLRPAALAGLAAGFAFLFRQDLGAFGVLVYLVLFALKRWTGETPRRALAFLAAAAAPVAPVIVAFAFSGGLAEGAGKVLLAGMRDNQTNTLPFPPLFHPIRGDVRGAGFFLLRLLYYAPVPLYLAAFAVGAVRLGRAGTAWRAGRAGTGGEGGRRLLVYALFGLLAFNQTLWRSDLAHLLQSLAPAWILLLWLFDETARRRPFLGNALAGILPVAVFVLLLNYSQTWWDSYGAARIAAEGFQPIPPYYTGSLAQLGGGETQRLPFDRAPLRTTREQAAFLTVLGETVDRYSRPGDYVLSVPGLQMTYFLFDRRNPTAYIHLRRALDSREEEDRYIRDLTEKPTRMVLLRDAPIDGREERRFSLYAPRVFEAIEREFEPVGMLGDIRVYRRKGTGL